MLILYIFNILTQFLSIFMANYLFEKCWCQHFLRRGGWGGGGSEKVYVLYTHLKVDNYGRPLSKNIYLDTQNLSCPCLYVHTIVCVRHATGYFPLIWQYTTTVQWCHLVASLSSLFLPANVGGISSFCSPVFPSHISWFIVQVISGHSSC